MKKSAAHQAAVDCLRYEQREKLAYHHILTATVTKSLERIGSVYDSGDSWVWQLAFSPRMRDAIVMETFKSHNGQDLMVRCFFLSDVANHYQGRYYESTSQTGKLQQLFFKALEMERIEQNKAA